MPVPDISQPMQELDYGTWSAHGTNGTAAATGSVSYPGGYFPGSPKSTVYQLEGDGKIYPPQRMTSTAMATSGTHSRNGSTSATIRETKI